MSSNKTLDTAKKIADSWWPILAIALLLAGINYQRWQYTHPKTVSPIQTGDRITRVALETTDKHKVWLDWSDDSKSTVVYLFTPTCAWCKRNLEAMRTLANSASTYRFIAISLDEAGVKDYIAANHLTMPVYIATDTASKRQLGARGTPSTLVVSPQGIVAHYWRGVYYGKTAEEIQKAFGVRLPAVALK